jgi:hypothetical protein
MFAIIFNYSHLKVDAWSLWMELLLRAQSDNFSSIWAMTDLFNWNGCRNMEINCFIRWDRFSKFSSFASSNEILNTFCHFWNLFNFNYGSYWRIYYISRKAIILVVRNILPSNLSSSPWIMLCFTFKRSWYSISFGRRIVKVWTHFWRLFEFV